jgi:ribulose-5-phosphate 4-epimerase/fuculose-1-phosphate aldolase
MQTTQSLQTEGQISSVEWDLRRELAACYQLVDLYGLSDFSGTHISVRIPGPEEHFLLNPYGAFFDEITASSLIKVDVDGKILAGNADQLNPAGFVIHSAVHMGLPDMTCVLHAHTPANNAIAAQKDGLLPLTQKAMVMMDFLRYHDYEGSADNLSERERIVRDLTSEGRILVMRNHGVLTGGKTIGEAFCWLLKYEAACRYQIGALSGGVALNTLSPELIAHVAKQGRKILGYGGYAETGSEWPAFKRKLERERGIGYRD